MNILLCCSAGMSSSIMVKLMREAVKERKLDYKIASVGMDQVSRYIKKADLILVAPQSIAEYEKISALGDSEGIPVILIGREEYGSMNGERLLEFVMKQTGCMEEENMDRLSKLIEMKLMPIAIKVGSNKILMIIRNAMCANMALLIIGSISVLLGSLPSEYAFFGFMEPAAPFFNAVYMGTTGLLGLLTAASVAYYASLEYDSDIFACVATSVGAFIVSQLDAELTLNIDGLGTGGLLTAIIIGFVTVKTIDLFKRKNLVIKMPDGVPEAVSQSFSSLIPSILIFSIFSVLSVVLSFHLNEAITAAMSPISSVLNTLPGYMVYHMLCGLFFFCGINSAVVMGVAMPFVIQYGALNEAAYAAGEPMLYAATYATDTLIWAGGTGATIGLVLMMSFIAKSKYFKTLGRMSVGPALFNINESIIFGVPICFNPLFLIPFILTPGILAGGTFFLMNQGIIDMACVANVPWTTPPVVIGFIMSNGSIRTTIWSALVLVISLVIYYPFFKIADKQQYLKELEEGGE